MKVTTLFVAAGLGIVASAATAQEQPLSLDARFAAAEGPFETGTYQALNAIEDLLYGLHRYGIGRGFNQFMGFRLSGEMGRDHEPRTATTFVDTLRQFAASLDESRSTLAQTSAIEATPFVLDVSELWFDVDGDATRDSGEAATAVLAQLLPRRPGQALPEGPLEVRFDGADHAWLMAYTHFLSAMTEAILAFDPTPVFEDLLIAREGLETLPNIPNTFDLAAVRQRLARLKDDQADLAAAEATRRTAQKELGTAQRDLREALAGADADTDTAALEDELRVIDAKLETAMQELREIHRSKRILRRQIMAARSKLPAEPGSQALNPRERMAAAVEQSREAIDAVYALVQALRQTPDADAIQRIEGHLREMLAQNRILWTIVVAEEDDDREWIPNAAQTNAFGLTVTPVLAEAWQTVLADAEALLDGRLLLPHPALSADMGVNVAAWFDDPSPIDLVGWIHGRDAYPYLARGPMIDGESWLAFQRETMGNGFAFALFFN
ncbi:MAG: hypothetical protein AAF646_13490 [Pseudomonadota bacterium]